MHPSFAVGGRPVSVQRRDGPLLEPPRRGRAALLKQPHARPACCATWKRAFFVFLSLVAVTHLWILWGEKEKKTAASYSLSVVITGFTAASAGELASLRNSRDTAQSVSREKSAAADEPDYPDPLPFRFPSCR